MRTRVYLYALNLRSEFAANGTEKCPVKQIISSFPKHGATLAELGDLRNFPLVKATDGTELLRKTDVPYIRPKATIPQ